MNTESGPQEEKKPSTENIWDNTLKSIKNVTNQATRYTSLVQKKIDLFTLSRKVSAARSDLGKIIDESRGAGDADVFAKTEVQAALQSLDTLRQTSAKLTKEIEELGKASQSVATESAEPPQQ